jgi:hypothetical protein
MPWTMVAVGPEKSPEIIRKVWRVAR